MDWRTKNITPSRSTPPKVHVRYPCPGLSRFIGMLSFLVVGLGLYYGGLERLDMERLDWAAPVWTAKHIGLLVVSILLGVLASRLGAAFAMTIEVKNERLNNFLIILWQFFANGSMLWTMTIGIAMTVSLGQEEARSAILRFGAELATLHVIGTGCVVGLLLGTAFFFASIVRLPLVGYLGFSAVASLSAARWHFTVYDIEGTSWVVAGVIIPFLLLFVAPAMIERDHRQRRLMMEQFN